ncbi:MAG: class II fructose-bisphosphate aldolase, partial [Deltaproteobacteria bacterium]|nr:class II fructose-bisphosphate aldolase [Deltaproteobacteria bacterium]
MTSGSFERALQIGRPPNVRRLFPHSRALLVSGKAIDRGLRTRGGCMTIAANGRNLVVIRGALAAAQHANAAIIVEIAKSEGGRDAYCGTNFWNMALRVDQAANELGITVPVAIHADHYGIKGAADIEAARTEIPSMFDAGITSIAIDASHLPDDENLLASLAMAPLIPTWAGYETEVGEIKGKAGMSTPQEAVFLLSGLNAHGVFPIWIALNNGSAHGIQTEEHGIQVDLTRAVHDAIAPYQVSGAQHGTSGNSSDRLREIATLTHTTKANVATALQMISWGVEVDDYGNASLDADGNLVKLPGKGVTEALWAEMLAYAAGQGWKGGNLKKLNRPFETRVLSQPREVRERMAAAVEDFVYHLLVDVFYAGDTAPLVVEELVRADSHDVGTHATRIEDPAEWTEAEIRRKAALIDSDKGPEG